MNVRMLCTMYVPLCEYERKYTFDCTLPHWESARSKRHDWGFSKALSGGRIPQVASTAVLGCSLHSRYLVPHLESALHGRTTLRRTQAVLSWANMIGNGTKSRKKPLCMAC